MRIGLISDTHIPEVEDELPPQVRQVFQGVDLILHAGDIFTSSVLDDLERLAPVLAALGDDDYARGDKRIKEKHILKLEGQTLWLVHMGPLYFTAARWLSRNPSEPEKDGKPDIIVFGHEHRTLIRNSNGILYVNPGSPTLLNYQRGLGTVGILDINSGKAEARIIQLEKPV
jgi:putative phosphoesterase